MSLFARSSFLSAKNTLIVLILLGVSQALIAHEGHDHAAEATQLANAQLAPRFEYRGEDVELVGVLHDQALLIYLDTLSNNAPLQGAHIELESAWVNGVATEIAEGVYRIPLSQPISSGTHPLTISVQAGEWMDLISAHLDIVDTPRPADDHQTAHRALKWGYGLAALLVLVIGVFVYRRARPSNAGADRS